MVIYKKDNPKSIQAMFGAIAKNYDKANSLLSFNLHRRWNRRLVQEINKESKEPSSFLDLCCGTGEIAFTFLEEQKIKKGCCSAYLLDFCPEMLACAQVKGDNRFSSPLHYIEADAQKIPLETATIDCATLAYGIRNIAVMERCFEETYRVLKPKGIFAILELTRPKNRCLAFLHTLYLKNILPVIGQLITSERSAYDYLSRSIQEFVDPAAIRQKLCETQFTEIKITPLCGGIATLFTARKDSN